MQKNGNEKLGLDNWYLSHSWRTGVLKKNLRWIVEYWVKLNENKRVHACYKNMSGSVWFLLIFSRQKAYKKLIVSKRRKFSR